MLYALYNIPAVSCIPATLVLVSLFLFTMQGKCQPFCFWLTFLSDIWIWATFFSAVQNWPGLWPGKSTGPVDLLTGLDSPDFQGDRGWRRDTKKTTHTNSHQKWIQQKIKLPLGLKRHFVHIHGKKAQLFVSEYRFLHCQPAYSFGSTKLTLLEVTAFYLQKRHWTSDTLW